MFAASGVDETKLCTCTRDGCNSTSSTKIALKLTFISGLIPLAVYNLVKWDAATRKPTVKIKLPYGVQQKKKKRPNILFEPSIHPPGPKQYPICVRYALLNFISMTIKLGTRNISKSYCIKLDLVILWLHACMINIRTIIGRLFNHTK